MEDVHHYPDQHRFILEYEGAQAILKYNLSDSQQGSIAINFNSTFVPPEFRGKGFAEKLVRTCVKWAKEQGYELHASCWYAARFIR